MKHHSFDTDIAAEYGLEVSIFLYHLAFWIEKNQANNKHFHDGRYWTYNSVDAYSKLFKYWTAKQMRLILEKAVKSGLVITGNYNDHTYDRKKWYALSDKGHKLMGLDVCPNGQMVNPNRANPIAQMGKPIADNKPYIRTKSLCASGDAHATSSSREPKKDTKKPVSKPLPKPLEEQSTATDDSFERFWRTYPVKKNKKRTEQLWRRGKLGEKAHLILDDIENRKKNDHQWQDKQYIPHPSTYLHNERWNDEVMSVQPVHVQQPVQKGNGFYERPRIGETRSTVKFWEPGNPDYDRIMA